MKLFERDDYRYSFLDGMCANVYGTLTGGAFLTGYAIYLEMNELILGLMMAIPSLVTLFQLPASYYICRKGHRKAVAYWAATIARMMWLPILATGLLPFSGSTTRCLAVAALFFTQQAFSSVSYIAWISWTSDLVPDEIRGTFFGTRNMLNGAAGIGALLLFGWLADHLRASCGNSAAVFAVPFICAVAFGILSSLYLKRISDPSPACSCARGFWLQLKEPIREANFRRFLLFGGFWNFSVYLAAPFFPLYHLRELHYSYAFIALLSTVCAVADLFAMRIWGVLSDKIKNKAVIQVAGWGVVFLPALWILVRPQDFVLPLLMQVMGGGFWAGVSLCTNNLLLRLSPPQSRVWFISAYSIAAGLGAGLAPVAGGLVLNGLSRTGGTGTLLPLQVLFIASTVLRILSLISFSLVNEERRSVFRFPLTAAR